MLLCVLSLSVGWTLLRTSTEGTDRLSNVVGLLDPKRPSVPAEIRGTLIDPVVTQPRPAGLADPPTWPASRTLTTLRVESVYVNDGVGRDTWVSASGMLRLLVPPGTALRGGDRVQAIGIYTRPPGARNYGEPDWGSLSAQAGRVGTLVVAHPSQLIVITHEGLLARARAAITRGRAGVRTRALRALGLGLEQGEVNETASLLGALLLGERDPGFEGVYGVFQRVGVAHVLAISGFHLALVVMLALLALRILGEHPRVELAIIVGVLGLGLVLIPMRPPIVRAGVIVGALALSSRLGRRYDRLTVLAWVGLALLIWRPLDALGLGYQLSMGVTALLVVLGDGALAAREHALSRPLSVGAQRPPRWYALAGRKLGGALFAHFACWAVAMPAILHHAGLVSLLAPLASLALVPLVMALMILGYTQIAIGVCSPALAAHTGGPLEAMGELVAGFAIWVDSLPLSSVRTGRISSLWAIAATALVAMVVTRARLLRSVWVLAALVAVSVWFVAEPWVWRERSLLRVDMLDVGDGSCLLLHSRGQGMVWDCGSLDRRVGEQAAGCARALGVRRLSDAIVTHDNLDHYNGLPDLASVWGLARVWITRRMRDEPSPSWSRVEAALRELGVEVRLIGAGDVLRVGPARIEILWPDASETEGLDDNDTSVVAMVTAGGTDAPRVLLTGDIEGPAMARVLKARPGLRAEVIELPHHGSARERAYRFLSSVGPSVVLQSTGPSRLDDPRWGHVRGGRAWYATAERGGAWASIDRDGAVSHGWAVGREQLTAPGAVAVGP